MYTSQDMEHHQQNFRTSAKQIRIIPADEELCYNFGHLKRIGLIGKTIRHLSKLINEQKIVQNRTQWRSWVEATNAFPEALKNNKRRQKGHKEAIVNARNGRNKNMDIDYNQYKTQALS